MASQAKTTRWITQDGADFYIYRDAGLTDLQTVWTYRGRVSMNDLASAEKARLACKEQCEFAGYIVEFPNPFGGDS